jgi:hypothetical protein
VYAPAGCEETRQEAAREIYMGSLGSEADHGGREMFHGHSDPVVDELNRLENLLRGLFRSSSSLALIRIQKPVQL